MKHYKWVKEEIEKLLAAKVICSSKSSWSVPIIVVPKGDGGKCLVIDYRALNKVTRKFTWPMPKVEDMFSKLNGATDFTMLDLRASYHHIPLDKPSIPKTAYNSPFGKYYMSRFHLISPSTSLLSGIDDWYPEGLQLCNSLPR